MIASKSSASDAVPNVPNAVPSASRHKFERWTNTHVQSSVLLRQEAATAEEFDILNACYLTCKAP